MAKIYLARARGAAGVERIVVLKHLLPEAKKQRDATRTLVLEAQLLSRLAHPNVVAIEELGEHAGTHFLAMEWVRGPSLRDVVDAAKPRGGVPWPIAARMFASIAAGLHYVHTAKDERGKELKIVHRDVTPENVIVSWAGTPKLLDFGIAKSSIDPHKTQAGLLKGKFQYIAPEQYEGKAPDARSDVFALSASLYEALAGESLYERASEYETVAAIVLDPSVPSIRAVRPDVPEALDAIVRGGLQKAPKDRTTTADAISVALEALLVDHKKHVRDADVAAYLSELFPGLAAREPDLARDEPIDPPKADPLERVLLDAEADIDADAYLSQAKRRQRTTLLAFLLLLAIAGSFLAWAVTRATHTSAPAPATDAAT